MTDESTDPAVEAPQESPQVESAPAVTGGLVVTTDSGLLANGDPAPVIPVAEPETPAQEPEGFEAAREGQFVDVVDGKYKGLFGVYLQTADRDENGEPTLVIVRNRDHAGEVDLAVCAYDQIRPSQRTGGR